MNADSQSIHAADSLGVVAEAMARADQTLELAARHLDPSVVDVLRILGFDKEYISAQGSYLYDAAGRAYLDFHTGEGFASVIMFFSSPNTVSNSVQPCVPWEFVPDVPISDEVRNNKEARQRWYKDKTTHHCFYTAIEGACVSQRVGKNNPPKAIHGFVADFDLKIQIGRASC